MRECLAAIPDTSISGKRAARELSTLTMRVLTIVDTFSRFSPALEPRFSFRGTDVVEVLERVGREMGLPATIRVDQGTEFVSRDLDLWAYQRGVTLDFSRPGKPTDNAFIEAFNGRFRVECLNAHWFLSLADAREKLEDWRKYYNEERPHGAIGQKTHQRILLCSRIKWGSVIRCPKCRSYLLDRVALLHREQQVELQLCRLRAKVQQSDVASNSK